MVPRAAVQALTPISRLWVRLFAPCDVDLHLNLVLNVHRQLEHPSFDRLEGVQLLQDADLRSC
jgi:hypothetical protein